MGMLGYHIDLSIWTQDMIQGMNAFKPLTDPVEGEEAYMRMTNGK